MSHLLEDEDLDVSRRDVAVCLVSGPDVIEERPELFGLPCGCQSGRNGSRNSVDLKCGPWLRFEVECPAGVASLSEVRGSHGGVSVGIPDEEQRDRARRTGLAASRRDKAQREVNAEARGSEPGFLEPHIERCQELRKGPACGGRVGELLK